MLLSPQNYAGQKLSSTVKLYTTTKLYSEKLFTTTSYTVERLHNRIVIIRQLKTRHIYKQGTGRVLHQDVSI